MLYADPPKHALKAGLTFWRKGPSDSSEGIGAEEVR